MHKMATLTMISSNLMEEDEKRKPFHGQDSFRSVGAKTDEPRAIVGMGGEDSNGYFGRRLWLWSTVQADFLFSSITQSLLLSKIRVRLVHKQL
jgi:hypothetical protein